jgi:8-oxo-dGTP diphosphatase
MTPATGAPGRAPRLVVGAAVVDGDGRLLAAQRTRPPELAGKWEFPGGKVEPGESPQQALVRECREELGVELEVADLLGEVQVGIGPMYVYRARIVSGTPIAYEHAEVRWLEPGAWFSVDWIEVDLPLVEQLQAAAT